MSKGVAHADYKVDARWSMSFEVHDVGASRFDRKGLGAIFQVTEEFVAQIDRDYPKTTIGERQCL
jgi:hypothetical protein